MQTDKGNNKNKQIPLQIALEYTKKEKEVLQVVKPSIQFNHQTAKEKAESRPIINDLLNIPKE